MIFLSGLRKTIVYKNFNSFDDSLNIFYANDEKDILKYRAGYYAGLKLVEQILISQRITLLELLKLSRKNFEERILQLL